MHRKTETQNFQTPSKVSKGANIERRLLPRIILQRAPHAQLILRARCTEDTTAALLSSPGRAVSCPPPPVVPPPGPMALRVARCVHSKDARAVASHARDGPRGEAMTRLVRVYRPTDTARRARATRAFSPVRPRDGPRDGSKARVAVSNFLGTHTRVSCLPSSPVTARPGSRGVPRAPHREAAGDLRQRLRRGACAEPASADRRRARLAARLSDLAFGVFKPPTEPRSHRFLFFVDGKSVARLREERAPDASRV